MKKRYDAVIAGYICVDLIIGLNKNGAFTQVTDLLKPGKLVEIDVYDTTLGGVVANTGMAMKKFEKNVFLNGLIGEDVMGKIAGDYLDRYHISGRIVTTGKEHTAFGLVLAMQGIDRIFLESPGCNRLFDIDHIDFNSVAQSRLFHFGYPPLLKQFYINGGIKLVEMFTAVQEMGVATSLDFSLPDMEGESGSIDWTAIIQKVLPFTDIFVPSMEEAMLMIMPEEYKRVLSSSPGTPIVDLVSADHIRELGRRIIAAGAKIAMIKAGHRGTYLWTGDVSGLNGKKGFNLRPERWNDKQLWCEAYPVDTDRLKNASGAGDTASAAFLSAILDGENPEQALKYAAVAGRNNLYCNDIYSELTGWEEITEEIHSVPDRVVNLKKTKDNRFSGIKTSLE
jgi:sugar/nucleoside kinase (ribokinase family)